MQWTDVVRRPSDRHLRQFAALFLIVFLAMAGWRWFGGRADGWTTLFAALAVVVGLTGLIAPPAVRPIYTGWMVVAFPIGWTVSRLALGAVFFLIVTPMAVLFRAAGRDALRLRRRHAPTYWLPKRQPTGAREYFRQS
jgi:hypothetical protein